MSHEVHPQACRCFELAEGWHAPRRGLHPQGFSTQDDSGCGASGIAKDDQAMLPGRLGAPLSCKANGLVLGHGKLI